jgi:hypothetical protein
MPTTYKLKNYERGRWKQEDSKRAINAVKGKATVISAAVQLLEFLQGPYIQ